MHATWTGSLYPLLQYAAAFFLMAILAPRLIFARHDKDGGGRQERFWGHLAGACFFTILLGYALVALKLFELIAMAVILIVAAARRPLMRWIAASKRMEAHGAEVKLYDLLDGQWRLVPAVTAWTLEQAATSRRRMAELFGSARFIRLLLLGTVLAVTAALRFHDALRNLAPGGAESYRLLRGIKQLRGQQLFQDGLQPEGLPLFLSAMSRLSPVDPLYIQKFTGPLIGVLLTLSLYFAVTRLTGVYSAGILAAAGYGWMEGVVDPLGWNGQAAAHAGGFAAIFVLPGLVFTSRYLNGGQRVWLLRAGFCLGAAALIHPVVYGFALTAHLLLAAVHLTAAPRESGRFSLAVALAGAGAGLVAMLPLGLGLLMGRHPVAAASWLPWPEVRLGWEWPLFRSAVELTAAGTLLATGLVCLLLLPAAGRSRSSAEKLRTGVFVLLLGAAALLLKLPGSLIPASASASAAGALSLRADALWAWLLPFLLGTAWGLVAGLLQHRSRVYAAQQLVAGVLLPVAALLLHPPSPPVSAKLESESSVRQYLRIRSMLPTRTWTIVSQEGTLAMESGFHMKVSDLLEDYDPERPYLTRWNEEKPDPEVTHDVFLFYEKRMPSPDPDGERSREEARLKLWIDRHRAAWGDATRFYEDEALAVYRIHREMTAEERNQLLWGG
ncbi:hypothetical protein [Gorillibacterium sp. sgz5001074]|uniref:hypothetical protein n=1 Tax=Gorillibacterium sp. sgz5001074 TaxID=3446695 RepID=UPI003F6785D5